MKVYFSISELCITDGPVPQHVADKLLKHHITPMNIVRDKLGKPVRASSHSGYRPVSYEKKKKRSGNSQHCFKGKGAVDWTATDIKKLLQLILKHSTYTRVAYYKTKKFIHCDFKYTGNKGIQYFESNSKSKWTFIK